jgi:hypothetical protein
MPRLIDKLDAAAGRTPELLDEVDYLTQRPSPEVLIGPDGRYDAGWLSSFDGALNFAASSATDLAFQSWIHLSFDTPEHFIVCNIADLARAGNVALLVVEKATGRFHKGSVTRQFPRNSLTTAEDYRRFADPESGSFVAISEDLERVQFSLHVEKLHLSGQATVAVGPALVQVTRFQRGRGSLQWYGALSLDFATLSVDGAVCVLPQGVLGTYDRTIGHQRGLQSWSWLAAAGHATCEQTGERVPYAVQVAKDREAARPRVDSRKYAVWVGGVLYKIPEVDFVYEYTDPEARETTGWRVESPDLGGVRWLSLDFSPRYHRRERRLRWLVQADFNQYYGELSGRIGVDGRVLRLEETFAVTEESLLEL